MKPTFHRIAVASALCLGLAASAAAAQDRPAGPGGPQAQGQHRGGDRQKMFAEMKQRREQRLHDLLQIKPDQEPAFHTFLTSLEQLRPQHGPGQGKGPDARGPGAGEHMPPLTTPERLDRMAQRQAERQQRMQKASAVIKTFYAALTPEQRKVFDMSPGLIHAGHRGGEGHGFGRHMWRARFEGPPAGR